MRTTIDLDAMVLAELRDRSKREGKSMGQLASELLAATLADAATAPPRRFQWKTHDAGLPRVNLEAKELLWRVLGQSGRPRRES